MQSAGRGGGNTLLGGQAAAPSEGRGQLNAPHTQGLLQPPLWFKRKKITFSHDCFYVESTLPFTYSLAKVSFSEMSIWNELDSGVKKKTVDLGIQPLCENYLLIKWLKISTFWLGILAWWGISSVVTDSKRHRLGSNASYIQLWGACLAWKIQKWPYEGKTVTVAYLHSILLEFKVAFSRFIICIGFNRILLWTSLMRSIQLLLPEATAVIADFMLCSLFQKKHMWSEWKMKELLNSHSFTVSTFLPCQCWWVVDICKHSIILHCKATTFKKKMYLNLKICMMWQSDKDYFSHCDLYFLWQSRKDGAEDFLTYGMIN